MLSVDEFRSALRWYRLGDSRRRCPHCRARLWRLGHIVIATRHCSYCGGTVLADPDPAPNDDLQTEAEFHVARQPVLARLGCVVQLGFFLWLGVGTGVTCVYGTTLGRPPGPDWLRHAVVGWAIIGWPILTAVALYVVHYRAQQDGRLRCPSCHDFVGLGGAVVSTSGRCPRCGCRVLANPEPDDLPDNIVTPTVSLLTAAEVAKRTTASERASVRGHVIFFVLLGLLLTPLVTMRYVFSNRFELELWLARFFGDPGQAASLVQIGLWVWLVIALTTPLVLGVWSYRRVARRNPLDCPHCTQPFQSPRLVLAGRRCDRCLEVAVHDA